jgi:hypothetical protein
MKNKFTLSIFCITLVLSTLLFSCKKEDTSPTKSKEELILGSWSINRIQLRLFYGGVFVKDTILKQSPKPTNYVLFETSGNFEYRLNVKTAEKGTYQFVGTDSVIGNVLPNAYRWKMLTLTEDLFTVRSTSSNDPAFPGATVERYQTFVQK